MKKSVLCMCVLLIFAGAASAVAPVWRSSLEDDTDITETGGEIVGGPATYVTGAFNNAFAGDGGVYGDWDNATVETIFDGVWDNAAGCTVDLYFSGDHWSTHSGDSGFWSVTDRFGGNDGYYMVSVRDGSLRFPWRDSYTGLDVSPVPHLTGVALTNGVIYHLTVRQLGTNFEVYLDDLNGGVYSNATPVYTQAAPHTIAFPQFNDGFGGRHMNVGNRAIFGGLLQSGEWVDEISVYNGYFAPSELPDPSELLLASFPDPADEASNVALNTDLSWNIPIDANETIWTYNVFFDTDSTFASTTPVAAGPLSEGESSASVTNAQIGGPLSLGTYYWRVDSIDPNIPNTPVTRTGNLWTFDAGATLPVLVAPANTYDPTVEVDVDLEWSSDPLVNASKIIITPDGGAPIDLGEQTSPFNPYADAGITMEWNKKYDWQIIELDAGDNVLATGLTWKFQVRDLNCVGMIGDIDGSSDCIVDLADLAEIASQWLDCNWNDGGKASPCP